MASPSSSSRPRPPPGYHNHTVQEAAAAAGFIPKLARSVNAAIVEDVAETIRVYVSTKGSPRAAEYNQVVPHRFTILKAEYDK